MVCVWVWACIVWNECHIRPLTCLYELTWAVAGDQTKVGAPNCHLMATPVTHISYCMSYFPWHHSQVNAPFYSTGRYVCSVRRSLVKVLSGWFSVLRCLKVVFACAHTLHTTLWIPWPLSPWSNTYSHFHHSDNQWIWNVSGNDDQGPLLIPHRFTCSGNST